MSLNYNSLCNSNLVHFFPPFENGVTKKIDLTVKEALALPPGRNIVLQHNKKLQQVGQATGLLSGFLGSLRADFQQLPICEDSWKTMNKAIKEHVFDQFKEAIEHIESQDASSKELSQNDSLAQVLEKEHPRRVRGLGFRPCPTQFFCNIPQQSDFGVQIKEYQKEIAKLKAEAAEEKEKRQTMANLLRYLIQQQGDNLPPDVAPNLDSLGSAPTLSHAR
ncbi:hypothetical protein AHAS_Ahas18G0110600 [Arachis hypogaea]|uniref:Uncharacterized protein n=1 Tax=Arachis hypogaea TaxID=3818 RepID=A0A444Y5G2_ARAHY|nr:hypothetical protein Ahy_B08g093153 [Arachis hypogaea]